LTPAPSPSLPRIQQTDKTHVDRSFIARAFGAVLLLLGLVAAVTGPIEVFPLYMFSESGRFSYEGFGFGSFMFANITVQIVGYYVAAIILIPLGYGHIRLRNWARILMRAYTCCWVILGIPLGLTLLFTLYSVKDLPRAVAIGVAICVALSYAVLPWLILRLYGGRNLRVTFQRETTSSTWIDRTPVPVLVLVILFLFYSVFLHIPLLFNGLFPLFGSWLSQLPGIAALDVAISVLLFLTWATASRLRWAWWADILYFALLTSSALITLLRSTFSQLLILARFPEYELQILSNMPIQAVHIAAFVGIPILATLAAILISRPHFTESLINRSPTTTNEQEDHI